MQAIFFAAIFGSTLQEAMYWYGKRYTILESGVETTKGYKIYFIIVLAMVLMSSIGTILWFEGRYDETPMMDAALLGAAFPSIFKVAVKSYQSSVANQGPQLGGGGDTSKIFRSYF